MAVKPKTAELMVGCVQYPQAPPWNHTMSRIPEVDLTRPICGACGTQFEGPAPPPRCHICDDPRATVPPSGQSWKTLKEIHPNLKNKIEPLEGSDDQIYTIVTQPEFAIGERAFLIRTSNGNVLWDLIALIDEDTVRKVDELGGIQAIIISHPHFYTTFATWSQIFGKIPVYIASEDAEWVARRDDAATSSLKLISSPTQEIIPGSGITAIKVGGHFSGSMVVHWKNRLFTADTVNVVPSGLYDIGRHLGTTSFSFMWSHPKKIPLPIEAIMAIIDALSPFNFELVHGGFPGQDINQGGKTTLLESAFITILNRI